MANKDRTVRLGIEADVTGEDKLKGLSAGLRGIGDAAGESTPGLETLARELEALAAATETRRKAEAAARADLNTDRAALAAKRDELSKLKITTDATARASVEFREAERTLKLAVVDGAAAVRARQAAVTAAAAESRAAAAAESRLAAEIKATAAAATASSRTQVQGHSAVAASLKSLEGQLATLRNLASAAVGGSLIGSLASGVAETSDAYANLSARIRLVTGDQATAAAAMQGVQEVAQRTNTSLESTGQLFTRIATAGKSLGLATADALRLTETINQALVVSGTSAQSSDAAITQLLQGLQSGVLRGEEFNSVMEQSPRLAQALADGLGVTTGELRKLAEQGALTSATVIAALQGQSAALQAEFDQMPATIGRSITALSNAWTVYVGEAGAATGASATAAAAIKLLADNLETVAAVLYGAGKAVVAYQALKLAGTFLEIGTATRAATAATLANTAATTANTAAARANAVAGAEAAAGAGRLASALATVKLGALVAVLTNLRKIGTAIGEGAARLMGWDKPLRDLETTQRANEQAARAMAATAAQLAQQTALASDKALGLTVQSRALIAEFDKAVKSGDSVTDALGKVTKALDLGSLDGITAAGTALDALAQRGVLSAAQIREALAAALKGEDLARFEAQARAAFDTTEQGARRLAAAIDAISDEALRRAGTSAQELATGFSVAATSAINDADALAAALDKLGAHGDDAGRALAGALDKALAAASTERAVQAVIDRFVKLGEQGRLTGEQVAAGLERARAKIDELKPGIDSLGEALRQFGLKTQSELQTVADRLGEAYKRISNDTTVSLADQRRAFDTWSQAVIAAHGGVETEALMVQRIILETREALAGAGDAGATAGKRIGDSFSEAAKQIALAKVAMDAIQDQVDTFRNRDGGISRDSTQKSSFGDGFSTTGQVKLEDGETFDSAAFARDQAAYLRGQGGNTAPDPNNPRYRSGSAGVMTSDDFQSYRTKPLPVTPAPAAAPAPAAPTVAPSTTHTVKIELNGRRAATVNVATPADAGALTGLLRELADAGSRVGV